MDLGIAGRRAAVAAASGGIGFATAQALVEAGCRVAICGRDHGRIEVAARELGDDAAPLVVDVDGAEGGRRFVQAARDALGGVDILVPNSGAPPPGNFSETALERYWDALQSYLMSVIGMCDVAIPAMREQGFGRVVAITSVSVRQPIGRLILSNTARAGTTGFLKTLALEVADSGITVNSVQPGYHATARIRGLPENAVDRMISETPVGHLGDPRDLGRIVAFLCSTHASFVTGAAIPVDGGAHQGLQ